MATDSLAKGSQGPVPLNRTCQDCRQRKIKCTILAQERDGGVRKCTRCFKLGLDCVFTPPATRKTRRRNETRIKELERKLETIQDAVAQGRTTSVLSQRSASELSHVTEEKRSPRALSERLQSLDRAVASDATSPQVTIPESLEGASGDVVIRGLVDCSQAEELYELFSDSLAPLYPLVLVPDPLTWQAVRQNRPLLFQAALTAASSGVDPKLSEILFRDTGKLLAEKVVLAGDKSLDLVQALLILATWHHPSKRFEDLKFSQYAHMAATMVMDIRSSNDGRFRIPLPDEPLVPSEQLVETCRTFLACYFLCSSMALSLRRPNMLRYDCWIEDCICVLEALPFVHLNDRRLIAWVKLQRLAEESLTAAGLEKGSFNSWSDARSRFILKGCVEQVEKWRQSIPEIVMNETMDMHFRMILISLHEPVLHGGHSISDFRPPYVIRVLPITTKENMEASPDFANAFARCIDSAQDLLRVFLSLTTETLLAVPIVVYTRMTYALIVLIKCYVSMRVSHVADNPLFGDGVNLAKVLSQLIQKLDSAAGQERLRVPAVFHFALSHMAEWYTEHFERRSFSNPDELIEPMMHINFEDSLHVAGNDNESTAQIYLQENADAPEPPPAQHPTLASSVSGEDSGFTGGMWPEMQVEEPFLDFPDSFMGFYFAEQNSAESVESYV